MKHICPCPQLWCIKTWPVPSQKPITTQLKLHTQICFPGSPALSGSSGEWPLYTPLAVAMQSTQLGLKPCSFAQLQVLLKLKCQLSFYKNHSYLQRGLYIASSDPEKECKWDFVRFWLISVKCNLDSNWSFWKSLRLHEFEI